jgi:peptidoglycan/xylan/chitin deacetylase (PgdA/CDA1 family)
MLAPIVIGALGVATLLHVAPFPFLWDAIYKDTALWRMPAPPGSRVAYLTFDDGPNPSVTPALLDVLKEKGARATFFLIDKYVTEETAPIVRRAFDEGHEVALHSADRWLMLKSPDALAEKLAADAARIESLTGRRPCKVFRPHGGWRSLALMEGARRAGYRVAGWGWMSWDWVGFRARTGERVAKQVVAHARPGGIIVIHDGDHRKQNGKRAYAVDAARRVVDGLRARGYEFGSVCEAQP